MPTYRIECGELDATVTTPSDAQAQTLVVMALCKSKSCDLGVLTKISGGKFVGANETYVDTTSVLLAMGWLFNEAGKRPAEGKTSESRH